MSVPTHAARPRSRFVAIVRYTLLSCVPPRRWAAVLLRCVGALLFGLLSRAGDDTPERAFANIAAEAILGSDQGAAIVRSLVESAAKAANSVPAAVGTR